MFRKKTMVALLSFFLVASLWLSGCGTPEPSQDVPQEGIEIATSISILADIVQNIVGDQGTVDYVIPRGENPEDYELLPSDLRKISNAQVLFINGLGLEGPVERGARNATNTPVVALADGIEVIPLVGEDTPDPHAWLDVQQIVVYLDNIVSTLVQLDPEGEDLYRQNGEAYLRKLLELDQWIRGHVDQISPSNRTIVVSENAFKYYGESYGFQTEGIWELNSHEEGTPQQIARIVDLVRQQQIPALFVETTVDKRYMETIARETGVPIAGQVYTDALGKVDSGADTYIGMMRHNTEVFVKGLGQ